MPELAIQQYKRQYQQDLLHGSDEWWAFAKKNNVKIGEYIGLMDDLRPSWEIPEEELRWRVGLLEFVCEKRCANNENELLNQLITLRFHT